MKKIRFIHAADLHLDSPFQGLRDLPKSIVQKLRESTFDALQALINHAIAYQVDFVIVAGDLFDGENRSLKAQTKLKKALEQLHRHNISCFIIHGNHDHLGGNWISLTWPSNVYFFKDEISYTEYKKRDVVAHLYGYSYPEKTVKENIVKWFNKTNSSADFHIGILHGTASGQEGHDHYAPFSVQQLVQKEFDYWALGHIHKRQVLHETPFVVYSGNLQGRHKQELDEKGVYLVELTSEKSTSLTFLPTSPVIWKELTVSIDGIEEVTELQQRCESLLLEAKGSGSSLVVILHFVGSGPLHSFLIERGEEFIEILNLGQENKQYFTYVIDKKQDTTGEWDKEQLKKDQNLLSDIISAVERLKIEEEPLDNVLDEVFGNQRLKRFVTTFSDAEQKQLLLEAESYLINELLKDRDD
ncbi:DNA repair exonuclease [Anaerobacillus alkaliphilus]|uniref:DNA repair exonuclease n=1 Tax=Anaerobacillus alkaliphilus TaxID=1548597 RepID=A0A4Q0VS05_9BACI|nr:DNA repair exonuclease [Anaerobacillus alkaliphilus]RXI99876.1 DNA repair exonuclease [Anaerobacillus alkaliphilus]